MTQSQYIQEDVLGPWTIATSACVLPPLLSVVALSIFGISHVKESKASADILL